MFQSPKTLGMIAIGKTITCSMGAGTFKPNRAMQNTAKTTSKNNVGATIPAI